MQIQDLTPFADPICPFAPSDAMDILAELGVAAPIGYDDYLEGYAGLNRIFSNLKQKWR
jgi:hypothetical protein